MYNHSPTSNYIHSKYPLIFICIFILLHRMWSWLPHVQELLSSACRTAFASPGQNFLIPKPGFALYRCHLGSWVWKWGTIYSLKVHITLLFFIYAKSIFIRLDTTNNYAKLKLDIHFVEMPLIDACATVRWHIETTVIGRHHVAIFFIPVTWKIS